MVLVWFQHLTCSRGWLVQEALLAREVNPNYGTLIGPWCTVLLEERQAAPLVEQFDGVLMLIALSSGLRAGHLQQGSAQVLWMT